MYVDFWLRKITEYHPHHTPYRLCFRTEPIGGARVVGLPSCHLGPNKGKKEREGKGGVLGSEPTRDEDLVKPTNCHRIHTRPLYKLHRIHEVSTNPQSDTWQIFTGGWGFFTCSHDFVFMGIYYSWIGTYRSRWCKGSGIFYFGWTDHLRALFTPQPELGNFFREFYWKSVIGFTYHYSTLCIAHYNPSPIKSTQTWLILYMLPESRLPELTYGY